MCFVQQLQPCMARAVRMARLLGSFSSFGHLGCLSALSEVHLLRGLFPSRTPVSQAMTRSQYLPKSYIPYPLPIVVSYSESRSFSPCSRATGDYDLSVNLVFSPRERRTPHEAPVHGPPFVSFFAVVNRLSFFPDLSDTPHSLFFCPRHRCLGLSSPRLTALVLCSLSRTRAQVPHSRVVFDASLGMVYRSLSLPLA
ncbi:hypothetical protein EDB85DRAFT_542125 [Lactarius pseudohatsudake]|nr:hypothetical protein EDB85DRAFT_542125 [Lactarius pseudohatsudake]